MNIIIVVLLGFFSLNTYADTLPYLDSQFSCTDKTEAQNMAKDFNVDLKSFGGLELCDSQVDFKKLANDLTLVKNGRFSNASENLFIRKFIDSNKYYPWLKSMTRGMNRANDIPAATAYNRNGYFTMQDGWTKLSSLGRVGTVIHEARHTEFYYHIPCHHGPYMNANSAACDEDYKYGGSHAVEMEYYARVSVLGENFHPVYKSMARLMAIARSNFVFNDSPIKMREALFAITQDGRGILFDSNNSYQRDIPKSQGFLKRTSYGAAIFDKNKAYSIEMYGTNGSNSDTLDTYSYFKLLLSNQVSLQDFEEFDINLKRYAVGVTENNNLISYNFPAGKWNSEVPMSIQPVRSANTTETGSQGYFLIDENNDIYAYDINANNLSRSAQYKWNPEYINIAKIDNRLLILKTDGKIYEKQSNGQISVSPVFDGLYKNIIAVPIYDGFKVVH